MVSDRRTIDRSRIRKRVRRRIRRRIRKRRTETGGSGDITLSSPKPSHPDSSTSSKFVTTVTAGNNKFPHYRVIDNY